MSYYNYPETYIHAKIASETSILIDYTYTLNKVTDNINNLHPDVPQELYDQQTSLMSNIQIQQGVISQLQTVLVTTNDLSNNPIDLSNNDLSNNPIDLSNNQ